MISNATPVATIMHRTVPVSLVFARHYLPVVRKVHVDEDRSARGAYVLHNAAAGARQVTLLATAPEALLAVQARATLEDQGIGCAVVSLPCWELFGRQDAVYRAATLGSGTRIAVEAACRMGWDAYLGTCGGFIGMSGFGASGPADALYEKFGITVLRSWRRQSVCSHIRAASWRAAIDCWRQGAPYGSSHTVSRA